MNIAKLGHELNETELEKERKRVAKSIAKSRDEYHTLRKKVIEYYDDIYKPAFDEYKKEKNAGNAHQLTVSRAYYRRNRKKLIEIEKVVYPEKYKERLEKEEEAARPAPTDQEKDARRFPKSGDVSPDLLHGMIKKQKEEEEEVAKDVVATSKDGSTVTKQDIRELVHEFLTRSEGKHYPSRWPKARPPRKNEEGKITIVGILNESRIPDLPYMAGSVKVAAISWFTEYAEKYAPRADSRRDFMHETEGRLIILRRFFLDEIKKSKFTDEQLSRWEVTKHLVKAAKGQDDKIENALTGLKNLGFKESEIKAAVQNIASKNPDISVGDLVQKVLSSQA